MATKKKTVKPAKKGQAAKKTLKKPAVKAAKKARPKAAGKAVRCCSHCPDFEHCDDKDECCDYCDYYLNAACTWGKKKGIPSVNQEVELPDYRGDDYGIDDYEAYEPVYE